MDTLLMVTRSGRPEHTPEAEPIVVVVEGDTCRLLLDDGEEIVCSASELHAATARPGLAQAA